MSADPRLTQSKPLSSGRKLVRSAAGWTLLGAGALLLVLPGPGIPLVIAGLSLLAKEEGWARRLRKKLLPRRRCTDES